MNSYKFVNYKLRPQKQIERGLLAVLLNDFSRTIGKKINYIGMGSLMYVDFTYFNKNCQLDKMISIEKMEDKNGNYDKKKERRFKNNKPLSKIELWTQSVSDAIEDMPLHENGFIWLDYDEQIATDTIDDLERIIEKLSATCLVAITFNGGTHPKYKSKSVVNIELCEKDYKGYRVENTTDKMLSFTKDNYAQVSIQICETYLEDKVEYYNKIFGRNFSMNRISEIHYNDNAKMTTFVWAFINENEEASAILKSKFDDFEGKGKVNLSMDSLTLYEKMQLDRCMPEEIEDLAIEMGLEPSTVNNYIKYAKYIPEYSEVCF